MEYSKSRYEEMRARVRSSHSVKAARKYVPLDDMHRRISRHKLSLIDMGVRMCDPTDPTYLRERYISKHGIKMDPPDPWDKQLDNYLDTMNRRLIREALNAPKNLFEAGLEILKGAVIDTYKSSQEEPSQFVDDLKKRVRGDDKSIQNTGSKPNNRQPNSVPTRRKKTASQNFEKQITEKDLQREYNRLAREMKGKTAEDFSRELYEHEKQREIETTG